jgi:hypothetical protein
MSTDAAKAEREIRELMVALEAWRVDSTPTVADASRQTGSGEAASRMAEIKRRLIALGARFHRGPDGYQLDAIGPAPGVEGPAADVATGDAS